MSLNRKVILRSPRLQKMKRRKIYIRVILFFVLVVAILVGFYYLVRIDFLSVKEIKVEGNLILDQDTVSERVAGVLDGSSYFFLPHRNIIFCPRNYIENVLKSDFPRIEDVKVRLRGHTLEVLLEEKKAHAIWCDDKCYFFDSTGYIFSEAPAFSGGVYKEYGGNVSGNPLRQQFLGEEIIKGIEKIYATGLSFDIPLTKIYASSTKDIRLVSQDGLSLIVDMTRDPIETSTNLSAVLSSDEFKSGKVSLDTLEYIDLRYGSKIYFK